MKASLSEPLQSGQDDFEDLPFLPSSKIRTFQEDDTIEDPAETQGDAPSQYYHEEDTPVLADSLKPYQCDSYAEEPHMSRWWALVDSGLLGSGLFLIAQVLYISSIPALESTWQSILVLGSWLSVTAACLYLVESLIDLISSIQRWHAEAEIVKEQKEQALEQLDEWLEEEKEQAGEDGEMKSEGKSEHFAPWLDEVHYDFWAALLFVIPSFFYLFPCLLDPNVVVWSWLNVLQGLGWSNDDYGTLCDQIGACLFFVDALICWVGRFSYRRTTPEEEQLTVILIWKIDNVFELDWSAWGDLLLMTGSICGIKQQFSDYSLFLDYFTESLWALDAFFYCIGCWPTYISLQGDGDDSRDGDEGDKVAIAAI